MFMFVETLPFWKLFILLSVVSVLLDTSVVSVLFNKPVVSICGSSTFLSQNQLK